MHAGSPSDPSGTAAAEAKPRCVYSILKPHGQSSRCQVRLLLSKQSRGAYTQFENHMVRVSSPPQIWSKAVVCVSTPTVYPRCEYFIVLYIPLTLINIYLYLYGLENVSGNTEVNSRVSV